MFKTCIPFAYSECDSCYLNKISGLSETIWDFSKKASKILNEDSPILITGESGTGKELFAKSFHYSNCCERKNFSFTTKNCSGLDDKQLFSELVGTSSSLNKEPSKLEGLFDKAKGGTLFLNGVGDLSDDSQNALLKALEERKIFETLGHGQKLGFRIIASTNKDLSQLVKEGRFRDDLYYRLNVYNFSISPLRKRKADIIPLALDYLRKLAYRNGVADYVMTEKIMETFLAYDWPGNIRELENLLRREVSYLPHGNILLKDIPEEMKHLKNKKNQSIIDAEKAGAKDSSRLKALWQLEKEAITKTLKACKGNRNKTSKILQISRNTLYRKIQDYRIPH